MSYKKTKRILLPTMALLASLCLTVTLGMEHRSAYLDSIFGRGERIISGPDGFTNARYYPQKYSNLKESRAEAYKVSKQISDEGIVLLKNDGLLPLTPETPVSPSGNCYKNPFYGGTGSSAIDTSDKSVITPYEALHEQFNTVSETPGANAVGLVFIGRQTGEGRDASTTASAGGTPHMLALTAEEREKVAFAKKNCGAVAVIINSSSPMQIAELHDDSGISAILWVGGAGSSGFASLGDILVGKVTPSGKTPDIYPVDFTKDPTFANFDDGTERFEYSNAFTTLADNLTWEENAPAPFYEFEEGVYLGYKYYETAYDIGALSDYYNRENGVLYPFGFGLSYTEFSQSIVSFSDNYDSVSITVRVKNIGSSYSGKDTIQIYFNPPYTDFDKNYLIEKPTASLVQFEKTRLLSPGEQQDITLSFLKKDMASYCFTRQNFDFTIGSYVLERGEYEISIRASSHEVIERKILYIPETIWYDSAISTELPSSNRFPQLGEYMTNPEISGAVILSRRDWNGTQPTAPTDADRHASATVIEWLAESDTTKYIHSPGTSPPAEVKTDSTANLVLADLRGKDYNDPLWDVLLGQLNTDSLAELKNCLLQGAYQTAALTAIGKPESVEHDGPQGLTQPDIKGYNWLSGACGYPSAPVMAATWNNKLMYDLGYCVGQEALLLGINGWYAPGLNVHRSPFGGRSSEYLSEDGVLSGYLAAQLLSGGGDAGIYCAVKHFVLMDSEAHRNPHTSTWLTEQALREVYLKPFELALKNASKTIRYTSDTGNPELQTKTMSAGNCIMTGDSAVGTLWTAANYELLTTIARGEWGFQGFIISDMNLYSNSNRADMMLRAGCDVRMSTEYGQSVDFPEYYSASELPLLRGAVKNLCYTLVNSNVMQGLSPRSVVRYGFSPWRVWLTIFCIAISLMIAACGVWLLIIKKRR